VVNISQEEISLIKTNAKLLVSSAFNDGFLDENASQLFKKIKCRQNYFEQRNAIKLAKIVNECHGNRV